MQTPSLGQWYFIVASLEELPLQNFSGVQAEAINTHTLHGS